MNAPNRFWLVVDTLDGKQVNQLVIFESILSHYILTIQRKIETVNYFFFLD